ncbi:hypothetical protein LO763_19540 [Glycomyces sp. A-F 0318]|uniref:hypothetical protein n=1 Tax=Glycomyces amatae TaxID=2881355 RepID=UPI001E5362AE|nr:hypothetical protein [Glycomyces amatae]MCD0445805.1 hypothetical protein [Glycomyces amatae]
MGRILIKPEPGVDCYAMYAEIVDGFVAYGTREAFLQVPRGKDTDWLAKQHRLLDRVDAFGTSSHAYNEPGHMGWRDDVILIRDGGTELRRLPRSAVRAYLEASRTDPAGAFAALERDLDEDAEPIRSHTIETLRASYAAGN